MYYHVGYGVSFTVDAANEKEALQEAHKLIRTFIEDKEEPVETFKNFLRGDIKPEIKKVE